MPDSTEPYDRDDLDLERFFQSEPPSWLCLHCGRRSYNYNDVVNQYCGNCHHYCEDIK